MYKLFTKATLIFTIFWLSACSQAPVAEIAPSATSIPTATDVSTAIPIAAATITPTALPERDLDLIHYEIAAVLDQASMVLKVEQTTQFSNYQNDMTTELVFASQPNTMPNGFELTDLSVNGDEATYDLNGQSLVIEELGIERGDTVIINMSYLLNLPLLTQGDPNVIRPQIYGYSDRQINLVDWYPMLVARDDDGNWLLHDQGFYGENLVYPLTSGKISIKFENFQVPPVVAASSVGSTSENTTSYEFEDFRGFSLSISNSAEVVDAESHGITVRSYYQPGYHVAGEAVLDATIKAVELYTELFGPIDNKLISAVQGDFDDGMEYEGMYFLSHSFYNLYDGEPDQYLILVAAHETCHQWFFGNVANDQAIDPWLDESISTYCEKLFYENYYPQYLDWWRAVRIDFYQPEGKIDGAIYDYHGFDPYTNAVYRRGALFYDDLRDLMGDAAFFSFLKEYYSLNDGKLASTERFFTILRGYTDLDLAPLMNEYFSGNGSS